MQPKEEKAKTKGKAKQLGHRPTRVWGIYESLRGVSGGWCGGITIASRVEVPNVKLIAQKRWRLVKHLLFSCKV